MSATEMSNPASPFRQELLRKQTSEISQWASWQQQQTLEEMRRLKQSTSVPATPILKRINTLDPKAIISKNNSLMTKLESRKAKTQIQPNGTQPGGVSTAVVVNSDNTAVSGSTLNQVSHLVSERDALLQEKTEWLTRLSEDNKQIAESVQDVVILKARLQSKMKELDVEKLKLKALQIIPSRYMFEEGFLGHSSLKNENSKIPSNRRAQAEQVYKELISLVATCYANQLEIEEFVQQRCKMVESSFVDCRDDEVEDLLQSLRNVASGKPGNVRAAEALSQSLLEAITTALLEKSVAFLLPKSDSSNINASASATGATITPTKSNDPLIGSKPVDIRPTQDGLVSYDQIRQLIAQNEALKVALMKSRNSQGQLKAKAVSLQQQLDDRNAVEAARRTLPTRRQGGGSFYNGIPAATSTTSEAGSTASSRYPVSSKSGTTTATTSRRPSSGSYSATSMSALSHTDQEDNDDEDATASVEAPENDDVDEASSEESSQDSRDSSKKSGGSRHSEGDDTDAMDDATPPSSRKDDASSVVSAQSLTTTERFDLLPKPYQVAALQVLAKAVAQAIQCHPLLQKDRSWLLPVMVTETSQEITSQLRGSFVPVLELLVADSGNDANQKLAKIGDLIERVLQGASVQAELNALVTMSLTFLFARFGSSRQSSKATQ